jgi:hypothetical protein
LKGFFSHDLERKIWQFIENGNVKIHINANSVGLFNSTTRERERERKEELIRIIIITHQNISLQKQHQRESRKKTNKLLEIILYTPSFLFFSLPLLSFPISLPFSHLLLLIHFQLFVRRKKKLFFVNN